MKNKKLLGVLSLATMMVLGACQTVDSSSAGGTSSAGPVSVSSGTSTTDVTSSVTSDSTGTSLISVDWTLDYDVDDVWNLIRRIVDSGNYTVQYEEEDGSVTHDYYTEHYAYYEASSMGYMELPDCADESQNMVYLFERASKTGSITIQRALSYNDVATGEVVPIRAVSELDYMKLFDSELATISKDDFEVYQTGIVTKNIDVITILANEIGFGSLVNAIYAIRFQVENETDLRMIFEPNFLDENYVYIDSYSALFTDIGQTEVAFAGSYQNSFAWPAALPSSTGASLSADTVSISSDATLIYNNSEVIKQESIQMDYSENRAYLSTYFGTAKYPVKKYYEKNAEGNAEEVYIDARNEVTRSDSGLKFDELFVAPDTYFNANEFRLNSERNSYYYYGYHGRELVQSLAHYDIGITESIEIKVADNAITQIRALTPTYTFQGQQLYTVVVITLDETRALPTVAAYPRNEFSDEIETAFSIFDGETPFKATFTTNGRADSQRVMTVADSVMLIEQTQYDTSTGVVEDYLIKTYRGYGKTDEGIVPFAVEMTQDDETGVSTGVAKASGDVLADTTMADLIGFDAAPEIFTKDDVRGYVLNEHVDGVGGSILGYTYSDYIIADSLAITTDSTGNVSEITYDFLMGDEYGFYGSEKIVISEWGTATQPDFIDFSDLGIWTAPSSWKDDLTASSWETMVAVFGDEAETIPYLYDEKLFGYWVIDPAYAGAGVQLYNSWVESGATSEDYAAYAEAFRQMLLDAGFVDGTDLYGYSALEKDGLFVRISYSSSANAVELKIGKK